MRTYTPTDTHVELIEVRWYVQTLYVCTPIHAGRSSVCKMKQRRFSSSFSLCTYSDLSYAHGPYELNDARTTSLAHAHVLGARSALCKDVTKPVYTGTPGSSFKHLPTDEGFDQLANFKGSLIADLSVCTPPRRSWHACDRRPYRRNAFGGIQSAAILPPRRKHHEDILVNCQYIWWR